MPGHYSENLVGLPLNRNRQDVQLSDNCRPKEADLATRSEVGGVLLKIFQSENDQ